MRSAVGVLAGGLGVLRVYKAGEEWMRVNGGSRNLLKWGSALVVRFYFTSYCYATFSSGGQVRAKAPGVLPSMFKFYIIKYAAFSQERTIYINSLNYRPVNKTRALGRLTSVKYLARP